MDFIYFIPGGLVGAVLVITGDLLGDLPGGILAGSLPGGIIAGGLPRGIIAGGLPGGTGPRAAGGIIAGLRGGTGPRAGIPRTMSPVTIIAANKTKITSGVDNWVVTMER